MNLTIYKDAALSKKVGMRSEILLKSVPNIHIYVMNRKTDYYSLVKNQLELGN